MTSYICHSATASFCDFDIKYYFVNEQLKVDLEHLEIVLDDTVSVVYMMYDVSFLHCALVLGYIKRDSKIYIILSIDDTTHSFMTKKDTLGDCQVCSLTQCFGIPDEGILY